MNFSQDESFQVTFLGTGTSIGVPVIGCRCPVCSSDDPKNSRLRSSIHIITPDGLSLVVDTGPDFRTQCLRADIQHLDAAIFTHQHSDHIMGFDDLRRYTVGEDGALPVYAPPECLQRLKLVYDYAFSGENRYYGYLKPVPHEVTGPFKIGETTVTPLPVQHGKVTTVGYLFEYGGEKALAYIPDAKLLLEDSPELIQGVDTLIIDALRPGPHPTHLSIPESIEISQTAGARATWFTHFSCEVDYRVIGPELPEGIGLAWDEMTIRVAGSS